MTEPIYKKSENEILEHFIEEEAEKNGFSSQMDIQAVTKKKTVFTCVFAVLNFVFISSYFFHFMHNYYLLDLVNIAVYFIFMRKYNTMRYLIKEVKSRPDEEIGYIVTSLLSGVGAKKQPSKTRWIIIGVSTILPLFLFMVPHTMYEHTDDGYYVRFYTRGLIQETEIEIPAQHRGEDVIGIRGNVFANLQGVDTITLPDTVYVIRGYAFAYSEELGTVNMPQAISYLGGSAFEGCSYLSEVTLPYGITEVKGSTFEGCWRLETIEIPEGVTRIGAHAFNGCTFLEYVTIPSTVKEIGSSAFRDCDFLTEIYVPADAVIDERAFKDSPTTIYYK